MHTRFPHPENADDRLCRPHYRIRPLECPDDRKTASTSVYVSTAAPATERSTAPSPQSHRRHSLCADGRAAQPSFWGLEWYTLPYGVNCHNPRFELCFVNVHGGHMGRMAREK